MSTTETSFPVNDLLRRKFQTGLIIVALALSVASSLFVLSLSARIGFGTLETTENKLTPSFDIVLSRFIILAGILVFAVGTVTISFLAHTMMSQRTKDIGLMKAAGCPNDVVFSYFMNELVIVTLASCSLGVILGVIADYVSGVLLSGVSLWAVQWQINPWLILATFAAFVILSLVVGARPIMAATKVRPGVALSPSFSYGLNKESDFKGAARAGLTAKIAIRSLFRRKSTSFQIILCLTTVFVLVTVSVAGGIIANETTGSWVERAVGKNVVLIAHHEMTVQYESLLSRFYTGSPEPRFNYSEGKYLLPDPILGNLSLIGGLRIDPRLVLEAQVNEVQGFVFGEQTGETTTVGDDRKGISLIVGVEPDEAVGQWFLNGNFLTENQNSDAVIGDTLASEMFSQPLNQRVTSLNQTFQIVGVCVDPINGGNVTYVPLGTLEGIAGVAKPNIVMVEIDDKTNRTRVLSELKKMVSANDPIFEVSELDETLNKQSDFLGYLWSSVMLLPVLSLAAVTICMIGYATLVINEQAEEFGILRAVGARPRTIMGIVVAQSSLVLISSWATGVALGIITTVLVLIPEPFVAGSTFLEIAGWLSVALVVMLISSLYPALRFIRKPVINVMAHH